MTIEEKIAILQLNDHNVYKIRIEYSGGGDDGCIDEMYCVNEDDNEMEIAVPDALDEFFYYKLSEHIESDWVNNSGGSGTAHLCLRNMKFEIDHYQLREENEVYERILDGPSIAS